MASPLTVRFLDFGKKIPSYCSGDACVTLPKGKRKDPDSDSSDASCHFSFTSSFTLQAFEIGLSEG